LRLYIIIPSNSLSKEKKMKKFAVVSLVFVAALFYSVATYAQNTPLNITEMLVENTTYSTNMSSPWGFTFIAEDEIVYTEKAAGTIWKLNLTSKVRTQITGGPVSLNFGQGGLLDVVAHPNFAENGFIYFTYAATEGSVQTTAMGRGKLVGNTLENYTELFRAIPAVNGSVHFGSRLVFDRDNYLYMSLGDRGNGDNAQTLANHYGKILRFNDDGTVPSDNPFITQQIAKPEIYSYGHRNIQGMALNPITGVVWAHEHGPQGGDELNIVKKGANYGWPLATFGENYGGGEISPDTSLPGMEDPITYWRPSIAPSGMAFIRSQESTNEVDIILGALAGSHVHRLLVRNDKVVKATKSFTNQGRVRDVRMAPNGKIYAMYEGPGKLVEIVSATERCNNFTIETNVTSIELGGLSSAPQRIVTYDRMCDGVDAITIPITGNVNTYTIPDLDPGMYCVSVEGRNANNEVWCSKEQQVEIVVSSVSSETEQTVFPNPVETIMNIPTTEELQSVRIVSVLGETVFEQRSDVRFINVQSLSTGTYFLTYTTTNGKTNSHRFVKR
jgi:glucose/arabinose dehydrogenase